MVLIRDDLILVTSLLAFLASTSLCRAAAGEVEVAEGNPVSLDLENDHARERRSLFGKRITSSLVAELGKRPKDMYSFGIGK